MVDPDTEMEERTRRLPVVRAGEHNHLVGGNPPADTPAEVAGDSTHPARHSIDRCLRGEGLSGAERYAAEDYAQDGGEIPWPWGG